MVVAIAAIGSLSRASAAAWITDVVPGSAVVTSIRPIAEDEGVAEDLASIEGVERVTPIASFVVPYQAEIGTDPYRVPASAVSGADLLADGRLTFVEGDRTAALSGLDAGGTTILPAQPRGAARHPRGRHRPPRVRRRPRGVLRDRHRRAHVPRARTARPPCSRWTDATGLFGVEGADLYAIRYVPGAEATAGVEVAGLARELALQPATLDDLRSVAEGAVGRLFGLFDGIALVALVIAGLGIVNTLTMNVFERVREIGVLRATGLTRRQAWRMVLVESGILGIVGTVLGIAAGLVIGLVMLAIIGGRPGLIGDVPWLQLLLVAVLGVVIAMLAAAYPARIASRVSIITAVRSE